MPIRRRTAALWSSAAMALASAAFSSSSALAFPPYRSTDADTAGAGVVEMRLGLVRVQRFDSTNRRSTPLTRTNFGLGPNAEIIAEFEYSADDDELADGAVGYKWARFAVGRGFGVETLALLPVRPGQSGTGIESQFLASFADEGWQVHINIGGFYDPRGRETERGIRASLLAEFPRDGFEPGVELFVKDSHSDSARVQVGVGIIMPFRWFQLRSGVHLGLSDNAPDLEASLWLAWRWE